MKPPEDLLNGPSTFQQVSKMHVDPPNVQELHNIVEKEHPNIRAPSKQYEKPGAPVNSHGSNSISSSHFQNVSSTAAATNKAIQFDSSHYDPRPLGTGSEEMEFRHSHAVEQSGFSAGRQSWNMEFKDATTAAQAAAESAERASMAARAAAELSSQGRMSRQHSTESNKSSAFRPRDEGLHNYASSRLQSEHLAKDAVNNTSQRSFNSGRSHEQSAENEQNDLEGLTERFYNLRASNKSSQLASSKSNNSSVDNHPQVSDFQISDRHSRKASFELGRSDLLGEEYIERESSESEKEFVSEVHDEMSCHHVHDFEELSIRNQSSSVPSRSYSKISSDDYNASSSFSHQKNEPFIFHEGEFQSSAKETNSFDNAAVVFDDFYSDNDEFKFDEKDKHYGLDSGSYYSSEGRKSSSHLLENKSAMSPRLSMEKTLGKSSSQSPFASEWHSSSVFSEGLVSDTVPSQADDLLPMTFDDSDGPSSESEEQLDKPKLVGSTNTSSFPQSPHSVGSSLAVKENVESNRKTFPQPSAFDSDVGIHSVRNQDAETLMKLSHGYQSNSHDNDSLQAPGFLPVRNDVQGYLSLDISEEAKPIKESSSESGNELNFGLLTGGLRNKGYRHPPYRKNASGKFAASKQAEEGNSTSKRSSSFSSDAHDQEPQNQIVEPKVSKKSSLGISVPYSDAGRDDSDEELAQQTISSAQVPNIREAGTDVNKRSGLKSYFDSDNSNFEDDLPKQTVTSKIHSGPGFSRRTKAFPSNSEKNSYSNSRIPSESSRAAEYAVEQKPTSFSSYDTEILVKPPQTRSSNYWGSSEQQVRSEEQPPSKLNSQSKRSTYEESSSRRSYSTDNQQNHSSQFKSSDYRGTSEQRRPAEPSKSIPESKRFSREESMKSSSREQPSNPPSRTASSSGAESAKSSSSHGNAPSRENSINKASHVHPKLPDYDTLTAHLLSLRQNRQ
ncbi:uncharacterized protein LOC105637790 isoform X2 [Jatropha curcas]|nr:uncharacterized protein LOC105637790 isoform X2 [Jatropha curcas]